MNTAIKRDRRETPRIPVFTQSDMDRSATAATRSFGESEEPTKEDDEADYGGSGGEDMRRLGRPNHTSVIHMRKPKMPLATGEVWKIGDLLGAIIL